MNGGLGRGRGWKLWGSGHGPCGGGRCSVKGRAEEQNGEEEIASRYISEGEKARHAASLCIELCGEGRRCAGLGCCELGTLGLVPISVPRCRLDICAGILTISVMFFLSRSLISHPAWEGCWHQPHGLDCGKWLCNSDCFAIFFLITPFANWEHLDSFSNGC